MDASHKPITLAVAGGGGRGHGYAAWALQHPDRARVVALAEPRADRAAIMADEHHLRADSVFTSWQEMLAAGRVADAVLICTQDKDHVEPAVAFLEAGWDVLLEKPVAPSPEECIQVADAARAAGAGQPGGPIFAVCHVLQYTEYTKTLTTLLRGGAVGEVMSIQHLEPVGWWHQAHSFVRGNWRREDESSPMLLAKSCHDVDWLQHVVGQRITRMSSFGSLGHFTSAHKPKEAADRCLDCPLQNDCAYSATRIYLEPALRGVTNWPLDVLTPNPNPKTIEKALRSGPYGRCVYACDNDVVDHQVVAMEFASGATGVFTMTAFTEQKNRETAIFGTQGRIYGDGRTINILDFRTGDQRTIDTQSGGSNASDGHGGGDAGLMDAFTAAVAQRDPRFITSGAEETLSSHLAVFAAERARHEGSVIVTDSEIT